jgi:hypothetical protein
MRGHVRDDTKTHKYQLGQDRHTVLRAQEVEDQRRRAQQIFMTLAGRKLREGEAGALQSGFTKREDGDTNWMCLVTAAELAKAGFEAIITDAGETIIKKVKKG